MNILRSISLGIFLVAFNSIGFSQSTTENYIHSIVPKQSVFTETELGLLADTLKLESIQYIDGLGRLIQKIDKGSSAKGKDMVVHIEYDSLNRVEREFLPFASSIQNDGSYIPNAKDLQGIFHMNASRLSHTSFPFSSVSYEMSPRDRAFEQNEIGEIWNSAVDNSIKSNIIYSGINDVQKWSVEGIGDLVFIDWYPEMDLLGQEGIDENGNNTQTFTDNLGRHIVSRKFVGSEWVSTYNVYDKYGNLAYVIQPEGIKEFLDQGNTTFPVTISQNSSIQNYLFKFEYDDKNRIKTKKIPGAGWINYFYNKLDQVVLTQDANQKLAHELTYTKYDALGRVIQTGIFDATVHMLGNPGDPTVVLNRSLFESQISNSSTLWEKRSGTNFSSQFGYSNTAYPISNLDVLTVNYYDDYDFDRDGSADIAFTSDNYSPIQNTYLGDPDTPFPSISNSATYRTRGMSTRTLVKILNGPNSGNWITNTIWYDDYGRGIQIFNENYINGYNLIDNYYNFSGELIHSNVSHEGDPNDDGDPFNLNIKTRNEYDHGGRLIKSYSQFDDQKPVLMIRNNYNELGQLIEKNVHSEILGSYLQSMDYSYNPRGWLTHINNCDLSNDNILSEYEDSNYEQKSIKVEDINLKFTELNISDTLRMNFDIVEQRDVILEGANGLDSLVGGFEVTTKIILDREIHDTLLYDDLRVLSLDSLYLDMDRYEVVAGSPTIEFYDLAEELLEAELAAKNITSTEVSDLLKEELATYITTKLGNVFYNDDDDDLWGMCIEYNTTSGNFNNTGLYNGNISEIHWKNGVDTIKRAYGFNYDQLERMKSATFKGFDPVSQNWSIENDYFNEYGINYDHNGNIQSLQRTGFNSQANFGSIDGLTYTYNGNQLLTVEDSSSVSGYGNFDFTNGDSQSTEYFYDANGNMIRDLNKGIDNIYYNHLNLVEKVVFSQNQTIEFIYDANGIKYHKITDDNNGQTANSYYEGDIHYGEEQFSFVITPEGRVVRSNTGNTPYKYEYHYTDHQNNLRLSYSDLDEDLKIDPDTEVMEMGDYYPFGMEHYGHGWTYTGPQHQYTFQGQEKHEDFGLNWSQFKWRNHMPDLGRFFNVDPLSEKYVYNSTYAFSENVLINAVELEGLEKWYTNENENNPDGGPVRKQAGPLSTAYAQDQGYAQYGVLETDYSFSDNEISDFADWNASDGPSEPGACLGCAVTGSEELTGADAGFRNSSGNNVLNGANLFDLGDNLSGTGNAEELPTSQGQETETIVGSSNTTGTENTAYIAGPAGAYHSVIITRNSGSGQFSIYDQGTGWDVKDASQGTTQGQIDDINSRHSTWGSKIWQIFKSEKVEKRHDIPQQ